MEKQHLIPKKGSDSCLWWKVAAAATVDERDAWMEQLQHVYPKQADFLSNISPAMWQNCEQLNLGYSTHFTLTNNVAESLVQGFCFMITARNAFVTLLLDP